MKIVYTGASGRLNSMPPCQSNKSYLLALDGSTSRSGICVMSLEKELAFVCAASRGTESVIEYKIKLQEFVRGIIEAYKIGQAAYEEPFVGYAHDAAGLYAIATILPELSVGLPSLQATGVANTRWKSKFIGKLQGARDVQKVAVRERSVAEVPALASCKDDETDAYGLAVYFADSLSAGIKVESVAKPRPFKFTIELHEGSPAISELCAPERRDGLIERDISHSRRFDQTVYELLNGKDAVLVLRFPVGKFGDMVLLHDTNNVSRGSKALTAVVVRKSKLKKGARS